MHRRALEGRRRCLGQSTHTRSLASATLGLVLERQGKYEEAEVMHRRALEGREGTWARASRHAHQRQQPWIGVREAGQV
jgi:hypothetical protein